MKLKTYTIQEMDLGTTRMFLISNNKKDLVASVFHLESAWQYLPKDNKSVQVKVYRLRKKYQRRKLKETKKKV